MELTFEIEISYRCIRWGWWHVDWRSKCNPFRWFTVYNCIGRSIRDIHRCWHFRWRCNDTADRRCPLSVDRRIRNRTVDIVHRCNPQDTNTTIADELTPTTTTTTARRGRIRRNCGPLRDKSRAYIRHQSMDHRRTREHKCGNCLLPCSPGSWCNAQFRDCTSPIVLNIGNEPLHRPNRSRRYWWGNRVCSGGKSRVRDLGTKATNIRTDIDTITPRGRSNNFYCYSADAMALLLLPANSPPSTFWIIWLMKWMINWNWNFGLEIEPSLLWCDPSSQWLGWGCAAHSEGQSSSSVESLERADGSSPAIGSREDAPCARWVRLLLLLLLAAAAVERYQW